MKFDVVFTKAKPLNVEFTRPATKIDVEFTIGKQGPKGDDGERGNVIIWGSNDPTSTNNKDGDMYVNYTSYDIFEFSGNAWILRGNIRGPQGPTGSGSGNLPAGGTTGQHLAKLSNTDYDVTWVDPGTSDTYVYSGSGATWNITHNMGKYPSVTVIDSGGEQVLGSISYTNTNSLVITFVTSITGTAYLN